MTRKDLEQDWLRLTRDVLPGLAAVRGWPIRFDHCFQRVALDAVFGGVWYDHVKERPAYRSIPTDRQAEAVSIAKGFAAGTLDLPAYNARSLAWRRARKAAEGQA
ncbi:MAG: GCN5-related N-acetyltransferase [Pacificimonas sp.]|jgi:hypothetical protein|nr:GCN5-related N-acetyltransferase [Pacificimonas sp.]